MTDDLVPFDLGSSFSGLSLPPWPPILAGAWYERGEGWGWRGTRAGSCGDHRRRRAAH